MYLWTTLILMYVGCGDTTPKSQAEHKKANPEQTKPKAAGDLPSTKKAPAIQPVEVKDKDFDPLSGKKLKEICSSDGLLLIKWPFEKLQAEFASLCCTKDGLGSDDDRCLLDWPFSDVPSCSAYDEMRNEIFARYGREFKTPKWQKHFGATDWYKVRPDFSNTWLSDVANQNVTLLVQKKKSKEACMD